MKAPVVLLHGFTKEQVLVLLRASKRAAAELGLDPASIAFATTTPTNIEWTVEDLLEHVAQEHECMKTNPPGSSTDGQKMA
ncbi:MAG: DUF3783 domain-containing protein [Treponemataceae bacterium]